MKLLVYFDGSFGPGVGGTAAYGFVVLNEEREEIHRGFGRVGTGLEMSNNVAEFAGIYHAMIFVREAFPQAKVAFHGDSELVINLLSGRSKSKKGKYVDYFHRAMDMAVPFIFSGLWSFHWIPRAMNSEADKLSQYQRYDEGTRNIFEVIKEME